MGSEADPVDMPIQVMPPSSMDMHLTTVRDTLREMSELRTLAEQELTDVRSYAHEARQEFHQVYDEVKLELQDIRAQTQEARSAVMELHSAALEVKNFLNIR